MPLGPDHRQLGRSLTFLVAACAAVSLLRALLNLYGVWMLNGWSADPSSIIATDGQNFDTVDGLLSELQGLVLLAAAVATLIWLYQAYGSREADPTLLTYRRWWTIGGWLVPFVNLIRPYQLFRDLYLATAGTPATEQPGAPVRCPNRFGWWWLCLVVGNLLSTIADRMTTDHSSLAQIQAALGLVVVSELILIAADVLFIGILRLITSNLWRRAQLARSQVSPGSAGGDSDGEMQQRVERDGNEHERQVADRVVEQPHRVDGGRGHVLRGLGPVQQPVRLEQEDPAGSH